MKNNILDKDDIEHLKWLLNNALEQLSKNNLSGVEEAIQLSLLHLEYEHVRINQDN